MNHNANLSPDETKWYPELEWHFRVFLFRKPDRKRGVEHTIIPKMVVVVVVRLLPSAPLELGEELDTLGERDVVTGGFEKT